MIVSRWFPIVGLIVAWASSSMMVCGAARAGDKGRLTYEQDVRPILKAHCFQCHGDEEKPKAKLDLRLVHFLTRGGTSGAAIVPGHREESLLCERLEADEMPPGDKKLSASE